MAANTPPAAAQALEERLRLLQAYFDLREQEDEARRTRETVRDRLKMLMAGDGALRARGSQQDV